jgi:hypothetical protein
MVCHTYIVVIVVVVVVVVLVVDATLCILLDPNHVSNFHIFMDD